jgi:mannose-6-phosphate isomerase-like protein (cupin superfamily)
MSGAKHSGRAAGDPHWPPVRRVVTGLDAEGRSCVLFDGVVEPLVPPPGGSVVNIWRSASLPADNTGGDDLGSCEFEHDQLTSPGSSFILVHFPPGLNQDGAWMHFTDTLDYMVALVGEVTLVLETGDIVLRAGDVLVDRGIVHGWRNDSAAPAMAAVVTVPALPAS